MVIDGAQNANKTKRFASFVMMMKERNGVCRSNSYVRLWVNCALHCTVHSFGLHAFLITDVGF